eukprot:SM000006S19434  [mRNA]  locus=s6:695391:697198:+ [translate_table: standard]
MRRTGIPARDLRILGPLTSRNSTIQARERAIVLNLEFIKGLVMADEVLLLNPLSREIIPFLEQLRRRLHVVAAPLPAASLRKGDRASPMPLDQMGGQDGAHAAEGPATHLLVAGRVDDDLLLPLPFEFQFIELALEAVASYLDARTTELGSDAYPALDELTVKVTTNNLERVRNVKSRMTDLIARVQKRAALHCRLCFHRRYRLLGFALTGCTSWLQIRDEIEQLLDDDEDMADMYLTRRRRQTRQLQDSPDAATVEGTQIVASDAASTLESAHRSNATATPTSDDSASEDGVEDLEMLLEAYFRQIDGTLNKLTALRRYIDDTEDYIGIAVDHRRNKLYEFQIIITTFALASLAPVVSSGIFGVNLPNYVIRHRVLFSWITFGSIAVGLFFFLTMLSYFRWKHLVGI